MPLEFTSSSFLLELASPYRDPLPRERDLKNLHRIILSPLLPREKGAGDEVLIFTCTRPSS